MPDPLTELHSRIRACHRCVDAGFLPLAAPVVRGRAHQRLVILGQAPGTNAATAGIPWSGTSGKVLRGWLAHSGIDPEQWLDHCYLTSVTKCFPGAARSGSGDRVPSRHEQQLCRSWLDRELELVQPAIIVTLGRLAAETLIPNLKVLNLTAFIGRPIEIDIPFGRSTVVPFPHPSGVSRWLNDARHRDLVLQGLDRLRELYASHVTNP